MKLLAPPPPQRRIYCNRTLNLRSIKAIGFDMDYTLLHYRTKVWEQRAYEHAKRRLQDMGWPVGALAFDPDFATIGLIMDLQRGNIVKANRFGYVKAATHGTGSLPFDEQRRVYGRELVDLADSRWRFMNTLFGLSEAHLYAQAVDLFDEGALDHLGKDKPSDYAQLYATVRGAIDAAHMMGELKAEILADKDTFVDLDPELPLALLDLKNSGKKLALITNSEWFYTREMMAYAFDKFLPSRNWRDLFDVVIVAARKPDFFAVKGPIFEVVDEQRGLLEPVIGQLETGKVYLGGHADMVEKVFKVRGQEMLYVGDHVFADVNMSKRLNRWRTALVLRWLEQDLDALEAFNASQHLLSERMRLKTELEHTYSAIRLQIQRLERKYGPPVPGVPDLSLQELKAEGQAIRSRLVEVDNSIAPLAREAAELVNPRWGLIMRAGNDKSHLARQIERNADIYMSRVSNLLGLTPFVYLRSPRGSLPHDALPGGGDESNRPERPSELQALAGKIE